MLVVYAKEQESSGDAYVIQVSSKSVVSKQLISRGISSACWAKMEDQVVLGLSSGKVVQYSLQGELVAEIDRPTRLAIGFRCH